MIDDSFFRKHYTYPWASDCYLKQCVVRKPAAQIVCFGYTLTSNSVSDCSSHAYAISRAAMAIVRRREAICNALN